MRRHTSSLNSPRLATFFAAAWALAPHLLQTAILCLLLMLAGNSAWAQTELITNGGFESGSSSWVLSGGVSASSNGGFARTGTYFLYLGGAVNENDAAYQTITIPSNATAATLSFYYNINSLEGNSTAFDTFSSKIRNTSGTVLATVGNWSNINQGSPGNPNYHQQTFNLLPYAGLTIQIYFSSVNDSTKVTNFRVDDVSVQVVVPTATPPTVQTLAASLVTTTSAQMNGLVNPNGSSTTACFEYGTTTSYGAVTGSGNFSGTSAIPVQSSFTGLSPNSTWHYRLVATNSGGTSRGSDVEFKTLAVTQQTGSLQVTITPAAAVSAGAQWQVDGSAFQSSGTTVSGLSVGSHTVAFKSISGWTTPGSHTVTVNANQTTADSGSYVVAQQEAGSLQVTIAPAGAVSAGAQWQVDGSAFQSSGTTVSGLSVGSHTVAFKSISGWTTPGSHTVTVNANQTTADSGTYQAASSNQFVVNGHVLSSNQATWVTYVGTQILPQLKGTFSERVTVASRVSWWSLKEGIFSLLNPHVFSLCHTASGDVRYDSNPLSTCDPGQPWQVGLAAVQVPYHDDQSVQDALNVLWPGRSVTDVLGEAARIAGFDSSTGTGAAIVASTGYLRRSWLLRHPVVGMYLEEPTVTAECIDSTRSWCYGTGWKDTQDYAPTQQAAFQSIADLAAIFTTFSTQGGGGDEIASLTATPQQASWVYYQSNSTAQWYISNSSGVTYLLSGAGGYSGELVWGAIANGNPVATVDYLGKTVYVAPSASAQTSATSYPGVAIAGGRSVNVLSDRGYHAAQQVDGQTMSHAWYFFQVQSTEIWYIVNLNGTATDVYRLRLKPDSSDYDWLLISNSLWKRSFSATASSMMITLSER